MRVAFLFCRSNMLRKSSNQVSKWLAFCIKTSCLCSTCICVRKSCVFLIYYKEKKWVHSLPSKRDLLVYDNCNLKPSSFKQILLSIHILNYKYSSTTKYQRTILLKHPKTDRNCKRAISLMALMPMLLRYLILKRSILMSHDHRW